MKKVLWMVALVMCLGAAGCSKEENTEEKVVPVMTDEEIEKALVGKVWHMEDGGVNHWTFSTTKMPEGWHLDYERGYMKGLRYFYGNWAVSQSGDAYAIKGGQVFIGHLAIHQQREYYQYDVWCTITPLSIAEEVIEAIIVYHQTKSVFPTNAETPIKVRFLRGPKSED